MHLSSLRRGGLVTTVAALFASAAAAQDGGVLLTFGIEQRLESGWNLDLSVPATGRTTASVTRLSFGVVSQTQLDRIEFNASSSLVVEDSFETDGVEAELGRPDLNFLYAREVPNAIFSIAARFRRDDVDAFDEGIGDTATDGTRTDYGAELRYETGRTAPVGFAVTTAFDRSEYVDTTDPDLVDTSTLRVGLETLLRFSEVAVGRIGLGYVREEEDDLAATVTEEVTVSAGLDYTLPNGTASVALSVVDSDEDPTRTTLEIGRTLVLPAAALSARLGVSVADPGGADLIGAVEWTQELPRGSVNVRLERTVDFDDGTDATVTDTVFSVGLARDVNAVSSVALDFLHEVSQEPSERIEQSEFAATYRYQLTEDWGLDSGLRYRIRHDADGRSESPDVFVALSRSFAFRP